jgi:hypothetical protein
LYVANPPSVAAYIPFSVFLYGLNLH